MAQSYNNLPNRQGYNASKVGCISYSGQLHSTFHGLECIFHGLERIFHGLERTFRGLERKT
ncbi:hypothetical protein [Bacteroides sp. An322]|uniref:hypothetical protein n=1 Tax=Bacteroides sp. An322 TaxID=1965632 RepID=UPI000B36F867|nr:hypothetical protein [Bacteroides sp. An322]OUO21383.1 hypothetical protein B5F91_05620 [Bacteroides sp. An322]